MEKEKLKFHSKKNKNSIKNKKYLITSNHLLHVILDCEFFSYAKLP
jgi:hypothetical protein